MIGLECKSNCAKRPIFFSEHKTVTHAALQALPPLYRRIYEYLAEVGDVEIVEEGGSE